MSQKALQVAPPECRTAEVGWNEGDRQCDGQCPGDRFTFASLDLTAVTDSGTRWGWSASRSIAYQPRHHHGDMVGPDVHALYPRVARSKHSAIRR